MALENLKRKLDEDKKQKENSPFCRTTVIIGTDGSTQKITERVSLAELLEDQEEYTDNPEDPEYRQEMEGEDW